LTSDLNIVKSNLTVLISSSRELRTSVELKKEILT
jgi:hypothetical protein